MKHIIFIVVMTLVAFASKAQEVNENQSTSLRAIFENCQYEIGKDNKLLSFTDKKSYFGNCNLNWKAKNQAEVSYNVNDSITKTDAIKIQPYDSTTFHKIIDLHGAEGKLEIVREEGRLFAFRYSPSNRGGICGKRKHIEEQMKRFPGCSVEPVLEKKLGDRELVGKYWYDFHHFMWRMNLSEGDFLAKQSKDDVIVMENLNTEASNILGIIKYYDDNKGWDRVQMETDSINYAYVFTPYEGRMSIVLYYTINGKMQKIRIVPREEAEFENIKFTAEYSKDVHEMSMEKGGKILIKIKPVIAGTKLNKRAKTAMEWKIIFNSSEPGKDKATRIGEVPIP